MTSLIFVALLALGLHHSACGAPVSLTSAVSVANVPSNVIPLATFGDGTPSAAHGWLVTNDPVMGGLSHSTFFIDNTTFTVNWTGITRIVPSLKAPGFCNLETTNELKDKYADVSSTSHLIVRARTSTPEYLGYKISFAGGTINPQFKSFKADFNITVANQWTDVVIPWSDFSKDWSPYTGECSTKDPTGVQHYCCSSAHPEVCPTKLDLKIITALGVWTEGVAGNFQLDIAFIGGTNP